MNLNITQILRPIRLAFLIQPNKKQSYLRAVRVSSSLWSGRYFPIFPIHKKFTRNFRFEYQLHENPINFYSKSIENFDPDYVVVDENLDYDFIKNIKGDRVSISLNELEESLISGESKYGISLEDILISLKETEFKYNRNDDLKIVLPKVNENDLFTATLFGSSSNSNIKKLKSIPFPKKYISFPQVSQHNFSVFANENSLHFLKVCNLDIYPIGNPFWTSQTAVYILDPNRLNDLINFWNLRALGWHLTAVPFNSYQDHFYTELIKSQQKEFVTRGGFDDRIKVLGNKYIDRSVISNIQSHLNSIQAVEGKNISYSQHWWIPRFWYDKNHLNHDKSASVLIRSKVVKHTLNLNEKQIRIPVLSPEFGKKYIRHNEPRFVNEVSYEFDDVEVKYAQIIPAIPSKELDIIIKGSGFSQWRFSENGMFFLSKTNDDYLNFSIPKARDIFEKWFKEKGFSIQHSAVGKLSNQLFRNIGGIYGTNFFATQGILPILSLFENGKIVKKKTLFGELSKQRQYFRHRNLNGIVSQLIDKNIIQFGVELQCTLCNQHSFYTLAEFQEVVKCAVCHNRFNTPAHNPDDISWSYRGIGTFSRNNKSEGIISVLLTLRFFRICLQTDSITPLLNFEIHKDEKIENEVDFALFYSKYKNGHSTPDLFFCECKTEIDFGRKDIERMEKLAKLFPGSVLVFATLKDQLSEIEKKMISTLAKKFRKGLGSRPINPILILTKNELMSWLTYDLKIKHLIIPHMQFSDDIGHLCDVTTQHYLGLPSHSVEVEQRFEDQMKKRKEEEEKKQNRDQNL